MIHSAHNKKATILIVDDQVVNRATIKLVLKDGNYNFIEAENGDEALHKAISYHPDIILMDAVMPVMDGFEATREIRKIEEIQRTPILMITSLDHKEDKLRAIEMGVNDFISKPFDKAELKVRCRSYVEIANLNRKYTLATINPTTHLPNKNALIKELVSEERERSLFLIKIDNFEENENFYGTSIVEHLELKITDELSKMGKKLGNHLLYHISGGKYAILLDPQESITNVTAKHFCKTVIDNLKNRKISAGEYFFDISLTLSYATGARTLYNDANAVLSSALMQKKEFLLASDSIDKLKKNLQENLTMIKKIKIALKEDKMVPYFQPIYNNKTNEIRRYEALIRLIDEEDAVLAPGLFLDTAKRAKFYQNITKVLVNKVIEKIEESDCEISINLSSLDIEDEEMRAFLLEKLEQNRTVARKMIFELLEDKETQDYEIVKAFIQEAKSYGVKIAIDDFGSGFSNFIRILEFGPDIIKIDGSLIETITTSSNSRNMVETIKVFADKIGAKTVAEFVSSEEIFDMVNAIGIDYSQGYYISKPQREVQQVLVAAEA
ncbi:MAG: hypothetical protein B6D59_03480 [Campylobacteraceae bacterium 4484_4]|nr:MAG: hypothetical protein B6D59_03480 [Campylobacteraceae bacterium 4484_4]